MNLFTVTIQGNFIIIILNIPKSPPSFENYSKNAYVLQFCGFSW